MSLKKYLRSAVKSRSGQSVIEYFILFAILAAFTVIAASTFFSKAKDTTEQFTAKAAETMLPEVD